MPNFSHPGAWSAGCRWAFSQSPSIHIAAHFLGGCLWWRNHRKLCFTGGHDSPAAVSQWSFSLGQHQFEKPRVCVTWPRDWEYWNHGHQWLFWCHSWDCRAVILCTVSWRVRQEGQRGPEPPPGPVLASSVWVLGWVRAGLRSGCAKRCFCWANGLPVCGQGGRTILDPAFLDAYSKGLWKLVNLIMRLG